jgi:hypothetical protein
MVPESALSSIDEVPRKGAKPSISVQSAEVKKSD